MSLAKQANQSNTDITFKRPESVLVVIYNEDRQFLLANRNDNPGFWQSITGSLEWGEVALNAAHREVKEETGIDIKAQGFILVNENTTNRYPIFAKSRYKYHPDTTHNTEYVYSLKVTVGLDIQLTEHFDYIWLSQTDAVQKVSSITNQQAISSIVFDGQ